jgi:hypothetical protein
MRSYGFLLSFYVKLVSKLSPYYSMNPVNYWYKRNTTLRKKLTLTFENNMDVLKYHSALRDDCKYLFEEGDFLEKATVTTLVKALKNFFK